MSDKKRNRVLATLSALALAGAMTAFVVAANAQEGIGKTCVYNGQPFGPEEKVCKEGIVHVCDGTSGTWLKTDETCS